MVNKLVQQRAVNSAIQCDSVPVLFVHVIAGLYFFVIFLKFECTLGLTFQIDTFKCVNISQGKYFTHDFENQRFLIKGGRFSNTFLLKTVCLKRLNIQLEQMFDDQKNYPHQENNNGNLVDPVHHLEINIIGFIFFTFAKEVAENFTHGEELLPPSIFVITHNYESMSII